MDTASENQAQKQSIFRTKAVERYAIRRDDVVLPRFAAPKVFLFMWALLGLLLVSVGLAWTVQVPVYSTGFAIGLRAERQFVVVLPANSLSNLSVGQQVHVFDQNGTKLDLPLTVTTVESTVLSPERIRRQFDLSPATALLIAQPSIVVVAQTDSAPNDSLEGSVFQAHIQVGTQRAIAMLPLVGRWFEAYLL
jgi:hypothetical protein